MIVLENPNSALRKRSIDVEQAEIGSAALSRFLLELKQTMALKNGVGIAAPQVGIHKRIIFVETPEGPQAFLNPVIVRRSFRKIQSEEGCLSLPGVFGIVRRHLCVTVEALNERGEFLRLRVDHFPAIIFQHEIDHLDGVLFIDKVIRYTHPKTESEL